MYPRTWNLTFSRRTRSALGDSVGRQTALDDPGRQPQPSLRAHPGDATRVSPSYAYNRLWPSLRGVGAPAPPRSEMISSSGGTNVNYRQHQPRGERRRLGLPVLSAPRTPPRTSASGTTTPAYGPANPFPVADPTPGPATIPPERGPDADRLRAAALVQQRARPGRIRSAARRGGRSRFSP